MYKLQNMNKNFKIIFNKILHFIFMGRLIHASNGKLLRYGNFAKSITKSFNTRTNVSLINQVFSSYSYDLLKVYSDDSINRTSGMEYENMNATHYYGSYNLKLHSNDGYWGKGTMYQTSNYLVKEENVFHNSSLSDNAYVGVYIPNRLIGALLHTYIYFFVTLDSSILGYNGHVPVGFDFPREPEIYPYNPMATDYILRYSFSPYDRNKNLSIGTRVPAKTDCYANVFIFIPNINEAACNITYNGTTAYSYAVNANFSPTQVYEYNDPGNPPQLLMTGIGYSLYVDGEIMREGHDDYAGDAEITFKNIY